LSRKRAQHQEQRWFKRALRWRAGIEATVSHLKHPFSMARALYKGERGFERYVGWSVITKNLFSIARSQQCRKQKQRKSHEQVDGMLGPAAQATR
jgi:transposase, IS5 family